MKLLVGTGAIKNRYKIKYNFCLYCNFTNSLYRNLHFQTRLHKKLLIFSRGMLIFILVEKMALLLCTQSALIVPLPGW